MPNVKRRSPLAFGICHWPFLKGHMRHVVSAAVISALLLNFWYASHSAAAPGGQGAAGATIDFVRDVRPILEEHCYECHGPDKQMNGFRLDRRRDAMRGGTNHVIASGSAAASRLYLRLVGTTYGRRMPLDADRARARGSSRPRPPTGRRRR